MTWKCNAITHGLTIFSDNRIGPCCQISADYLKPIEEISNPDRFSDLLTENVPSACEKCSAAESMNLPSYRSTFNRYKINEFDKRVVFLDIRNTNLCNLKCRYCGPHFSNQWGAEIGIKDSLRSTKIDPYFDQIGLIVTV
jgi:MoaA/NifB/PqqE/SkfB family radical SAM enzyme